MESQNLHTASIYINNLLLARGLLRNGKSIEFAKPSQDEGGTDATMAKIINLVHDLILRRDRDADQRENLAFTIRDFRSTETRTTTELERLRTRNADCDRQLSIALGQERAFKTTLRTAENANKSLREEMQRTRTMLQQVRTQCANDIRKRDVQIQKLKSHLTSQQRGTRAPSSNTTINITPSASISAFAHTSREEGAPLDSSDYSLKQETTDFLTQLSQKLCDENDNLISLLRGSLNNLRTLQGLPSKSSSHGLSQETSISGEDKALDDAHASANPFQTLPTSSDAFAAEMDEVLDHLRTLLTNPSFVPLEEVEVREEEIIRLREGWEKMEERWRDAVALMDGWRKRLASGGGSINIDDLRIGLSLSPVRMSKSGSNEQGENSLGRVLQQSQGFGSTLPRQARQEHSPDPEAASDGVDSIFKEGSEDSPGGLGVGLCPDGRVLEEINPNSNCQALQGDVAAASQFKALADSSSSTANDTNDATDELQSSNDASPRHRTSPTLLAHPPKRAVKPKEVTSNVSRIPKQVITIHILKLGWFLSRATTNQEGRKPADKVPITKGIQTRRTNGANAATIKQKLNEARREAEKTVERKNREAENASGGSIAARSTASTKAGSNKRDHSKTMTKRTSRRRTTLSADELACLIGA
ncbi:MAG: hypothetical protein M4579_002319 [Chaenotheca gracillima]|nr:MAG: hypothetical protein M4579_002319 [Chaenotheca gracillima]